MPRSETGYGATRKKMNDQQQNPVEAFRLKYMSLTMRKVSTQTRYRISMDDRDVYEMLKIAYSANVARCGYIFSEDAETQKKIHGMAGWLTSSKAKPGMLLCGTCGNGKTTLAECLLYVTKGSDQHTAQPGKQPKCDTSCPADDPDKCAENNTGVHGTERRI